MVVSSAQNLPANASPKQNVNWMKWGPYLDGQLTFRLLLRTNSILLRLKELALGESLDRELSPYMPRVGHCNKVDFEAQGWQAAI